MITEFKPYTLAEQASLRDLALHRPYTATQICRIYLALGRDIRATRDVLDRAARENVDPEICLEAAKK